MNETEAKQRLTRMVEYIEADAQKKIEQIDLSAEEEYFVEKGNIAQNQCLRILKYYHKKERDLQRQKRVLRTQLKNEARIAVLNSRDNFINSILVDVANNLQMKMKDVPTYQKILEGYILQGAFALMEKRVTIKCLKGDKQLVRNIIPTVTNEYKKATSIDVSITIGKDALPEAHIGGIEVYGSSDSVKVSNTFLAKINLLRERAVPYMRLILFGINPNRKFVD